MTFHLPNSHNTDLSPKIRELDPGPLGNISDGRLSGAVLDTSCKRSWNPVSVYLPCVQAQMEVYERPGDGVKSVIVTKLAS